MINDHHEQTSLRQSSAVLWFIPQDDRSPCRTPYSSQNTLTLLWHQGRLSAPHTCEHMQPSTVTAFRNLFAKIHRGTLGPQLFTLWQYK